ncbi:hypothetical protein AMTRI_Chr10g5610 [Amborella trichopoda]
MNACRFGMAIMDFLEVLMAFAMRSRAYAIDALLQVPLRCHDYGTFSHLQFIDKLHLRLPFLRGHEFHYLGF